MSKYVAETDAITLDCNIIGITELVMVPLLIPNSNVYALIRHFSLFTMEIFTFLLASCKDHLQRVKYRPQMRTLKLAAVYQISLQNIFFNYQMLRLIIFGCVVV